MVVSAFLGDQEGTPQGRRDRIGLRGGLDHGGDCTLFFFFRCLVMASAGCAPVKAIARNHARGNHRNGRAPRAAAPGGDASGVDPGGVGEAGARREGRGPGQAWAGAV